MVTFKGIPIRLSADFSKETAGKKRLARSIQSDEKQRPRLLYPAKLSFKMEGEIKCFPDKVKLKEFIITKPLLHELLAGVSNLCPIGHMQPRMDMNVAQHKIVNLLKTFFFAHQFSLVFV